MVETRPVLLVEDNPDDIELTLRAFRKSNLANDLVIVRDGVEALDFIYHRNGFESRNGNSLPGIVLLDLKLPKVGGLEVLKAIKAHSETRLLPVIVLTSSKEEEDMISSYGLGANSFIRKPVDFKQFIRAVQQLGMYWLLLNETPQAGIRPDLKAGFSMQNNYSMIFRYFYHFD